MLTIDGVPDSEYLVFFWHSVDELGQILVVLHAVVGCDESTVSIQKTRFRRYFD